MKLISVMSRGNRIVRMVSPNNSNWDCETIEKEWVWHEKTGWKYRIEECWCGKLSNAIKRAVKWLEGAKQ